MMKCGHFFAGIFGFGIAASMMGWQNVWHSEINEYCNRIIRQYYPNSIPYGDIREINFEEMQTVDLVTGGFPCQPYSHAGERRGDKDERHLWPEMLAGIKVHKPRWIVAENVYGITNWSDGMVFEQVQTDLEDEGYEVQAYILPAAGVNAPHRRYRVWFVGYSDRFGRDETEAKSSGESTGIITPARSDSNDDASNPSKQGLEGGKESGQRQEHVRSERSGRTRNAPNPTIDRLQRGGNQTELYRSRKGAEQRPENMGGLLSGQWEDFPSESPVCGGNDGFPNRVERIEALGNAIVPQVALQIFKAIQEYEDKHG